MGAAQPDQSGSLSYSPLPAQPLGWKCGPVPVERTTRHHSAAVWRTSIRRVYRILAARQGTLAHIGGQKSHTEMGVVTSESPGYGETVAQCFTP